MRKEEFLLKARSKHGYKYEYLNLPDKLIRKDYIHIKFQDNVYKQNVGKHLMGKSPEKMTPKKTIEDFIEESKRIWGDRFDYSQTVYRGALKKVKLLDKMRGIMIEQIASLHLQGHECKNLDKEEFINLSKVSSDFSYGYEKCEYINSTTKVELICPQHGSFLVIPFNHLNYGNGCKKCDFHIFNKKVKKFLDSKKIIHNCQYKFKDCNLPYDFYIPSMRVCIEFIKEPVNESEELKTNTKIKNDYCEENFINLIRIRYDQIDKIEEILKENLKNLIKFAK